MWFKPIKRNNRAAWNIKLKIATRKMTIIFLHPRIIFITIITLLSKFSFKSSLFFFKKKGGIKRWNWGFLILNQDVIFFEVHLFHSFSKYSPFLQNIIGLLYKYNGSWYYCINNIFDLAERVVTETRLKIEIVLSHR